MFKKIFATSLFAVLLAPSAYALQFTSLGLIEFEQNRRDEMFLPLYIIAEEDNLITAEHGLTIMLPTGAAIQWDLDQSGLNFQGDAANKVDTENTYTISDDLYSIHINLTEDFVDGDRLEIHDLRPRTYDDQVSEQALHLDYNGDGVNDIVNVHVFRVVDENTDFIKTYDIENLAAEYDHANKQVNLSWKNPPDYDFVRVNLRRERNRDGAIAQKDVYGGAANTAVDKSLIRAIDFEVGDILTYYLKAIDVNDNATDEISLSIDIVEPGTEPQSEDDEGEEVPVEEAEDSETDEEEAMSEEETLLNRLFAYYKVRYQIKCLSATALLRGPNNDECRWAKINLVYAQEKLDRLELNVSLSERDLDLMARRVRWPEMRYQTRCIEAETPHRTCNALGRSLDRVHYFLNK